MSMSNAGAVFFSLLSIIGLYNLKYFSLILLTAADNGIVSLPVCIRLWLSELVEDAVFSLHAISLVR